MLRQSWTFTYATERVANAADEKARPLRKNVAEMKAKLNEHNRVIGQNKVDEYNLGSHPENVQAMYRESKALPPLIQDEANQLAELDFFIRILRQHPGEVVTMGLDDIRYFGLDKDEEPARLPLPEPTNVMYGQDFTERRPAITVVDPKPLGVVMETPLDIDEQHRYQPMPPAPAKSSPAKNPPRRPVPA